MKNFSHMPNSEWNEIVAARQNMTFLITTSEFDISEIVELKTAGREVEVPPTPVALDDETIIKASLLAPSGTAGRWQLFVLLTYRNGGKFLMFALITVT